MSDPVNSPDHYQAGDLEAIDVIEAFFPDNYHLGNAFKYLARAGKKDDEVQDLQKAIWYINRYLDNLSDEDVEFRYTITGYGLEKMGRPFQVGDQVRCQGSDVDFNYDGVGVIVETSPVGSLHYKVYLADLHEPYWYSGKQLTPMGGGE